VFSNVLIANRGEIAVRVIRTCRELGIATTAVYSELDRDAAHVRMADAAYAIGGRSSQESYLNTEAILDVIRRSGADAVHPGYGFFSENAEFARAVAGTGAAFVGPPPEAIEAMGDKISARRVAERVGVAGVPGRTEPVTEPGEVVRFGEEHGWPVAIKAAFGGGGRGMKVVESADQAADAMESASREAQAYFGRPEIYLERYLTWPRHIEMQVLCDAHGNAVWLGERDCSSQRRHQKLVEETPAPDFPGEIRSRMGEAALAVARACGYVNAGTVEFLYQDGSFYFLEMNTRLQVEHPVTELTCGLDLVALQLAVAAGEPLPFGQADVVRSGHAIECRINAEDPTGGRFLPSPGRITRMRIPSGPGVRMDSGYDEGDEVSQYYDNLVAKLSVWASDRESARRRMLRALGELEISGIATTTPAHIAILSSQDFSEARHSTRWVEEGFDLAHALEEASTRSTVTSGRLETSSPSPPTEVPALTEERVTAEVNGRRYEVRLWMASEPDPPAHASPSERGARRTSQGASPSRGPVAAGASTATSRPAGQGGAAAGARSAGGGAGEVAVPMQGTIVKILVSEGDSVESGQTVCVLEAMKMENAIGAETAGTVQEVRVSPGDTVGAGDIVLVIG